MFGIKIMRRDVQLMPIRARSIHKEERDAKYINWTISLISKQTVVMI